MPQPAKSDRSDLSSVCAQEDIEALQAPDPLDQTQALAAVLYTWYSSDTNSRRTVRWDALAELQANPEAVRLLLEKKWAKASYELGDLLTSQYSAWTSEYCPDQFTMSRLHLLFSSPLLKLTASGMTKGHSVLARRAKTKRESAPRGGAPERGAPARKTGQRRGAPVPDRGELAAREVQWDAILKKFDTRSSEDPTQVDIAALRECWSLYPVLAEHAHTQYKSKRKKVRKRHAEVLKAFAWAGNLTPGLDSLGASIKAANKVVEKRLRLLNQLRGELTPEFLALCAGRTVLEARAERVEAARESGPSRGSWPPKPLSPSELELVREQQAPRKEAKKNRHIVMALVAPLELLCATPILTWPDSPSFVEFDSEGTPAIVDLTKTSVPPTDVQTINRAAELLDKLCLSWEEPPTDDTEANEHAGREEDKKRKKRAKRPADVNWNGSKLESWDQIDNCILLVHKNEYPYLEFRCKGARAKHYLATKRDGGSKESEFYGQLVLIDQLAVSRFKKECMKRGKATSAGPSMDSVKRRIKELNKLLEKCGLPPNGVRLSGETIRLAFKIKQPDSPVAAASSRQLRPGNGIGDSDLGQISNTFNTGNNG